MKLKEGQTITVCTRESAPYHVDVCLSLDVNDYAIAPMGKFYYEVSPIFRITAEYNMKGN
jgi:hypothetical protein